MVWSLDHLGRPSGREERSDAARNRRVILDTARTLFEGRGVTCVTMEEIARTSGVGKGTLYRRFPHKGYLCQALLDEPTRHLQGQTLELLREPGTSALEKLDVFLDRLVAFTAENLDLLYGGHEPLCGADRLERFSHPAYDWRRSTVLGLLRTSVREGEADDKLDLEYLAAALLAPLDVDLYYYQHRVQGLSVERISRGVRALVPRAG
ncbi:MAG: TetR/AcrR family transcriptional regulator [Rubrobacteraceae bacterium]|nr:TetR/AcrR family transcriptional regulator [Rubrobacteraceae bacterium]